MTSARDKLLRLADRLVGPLDESGPSRVELEEEAAREIRVLVEERDELRRLLMLALSELSPSHYRRAEIEKVLKEPKP